ncbi:histidine kinase [Treponema sp. OMZ 840]|uniref:sensor histidine kinase n=1 Tax=Treponema sp. OMZ 840 TaxID=244313 RepID=UPI003D8AB59B
MKHERGQDFNSSVKSAFFHYVAILILFFLLLWLTFISCSVYIVVQSNLKTNTKLRSVLSKEITDYIVFLESLANNEVLHSYILDRENKDLLYKILYDFNRNRQCKCLFYVLDTDANILITNAWQMGENYIINNSLHKQILEIADIDEGKIIGYTSHEKRVGNNDIVYILGNKIRMNTAASCFIICEMLETDLMSVISTTDLHAVVLSDNYDTIIATNHHRIKDTWNRFTYEKTLIPSVISLNKIHYLITQCLLQGTNISVTILTSITILEQMILYGFLLIFFFSTLILAMMNILSSSVAKKLSTPVIQLKNAISEFQAGNLDYKLQLENNDEFQYLSNQYIELVSEIKNLINQNIAISNQTRLAEIRLLQAQFDPHFLFNVLQIIYYTNYDNPAKSNEIIELLAGLLRYSLGSKNTQVEIKEDLSYIKTYLELQKIRLEEKLQYSINISKDLYKSKIPKLLLQPLVENCIKYRHYKENLSIKITGIIIKGIVILHVKDNGDGISEEQLQKLNEKLNKEWVPTSKHLGLLNTHYRLRLVYGSAYGIKIKSKLKKGTDIRLAFPAKQSD